MRTAKVLTIAVLMSGALSLFSCEKDKTYPDGNGIPNLPASDTVRPAFVNTSNMDVYVRVYNSETDYNANSNIVASGLVTKGQQFSFKTIKGSDSLKYVIEWFSANGYTSNWLDSPKKRMFAFAKNNGVRYMKFGGGTTDSSHLFTLGVAGDSTIWESGAYRDSVTIGDSVDITKAITLYRDFTAKVVYNKKQGSDTVTTTDMLTYKINVTGQDITVSLYNSGAYYGYLINRAYDLKTPAGTDNRHNRAKAKFKGNNRLYSMFRKL